MSTLTPMRNGLRGPQVAVAVPSALFLRAKVCLDDTASRLLTIPSKVRAA